jgi:hypothetical protein
MSDAKASNTKADILAALNQHDIADRIYKQFLKEADGLPEPQWRALLLTCAGRLLTGLSCSLAVDVSKEALGFRPVCRVSENGFGRWILLHSENPRRAWSGSTWVPVNQQGLPASGVQVSNFDTPEAAAKTAREQGLALVSRYPD